MSGIGSLSTIGSTGYSAATDRMAAAANAIAGGGERLEHAVVDLAVAETTAAANLAVVRSGDEALEALIDAMLG